MDHSNPRFDSQIKSLLEKAIQKAESQLEKNAADIDALHYSGLAYTYLGRLEAQRGRLYEGGVKGEVGRKFLEKAIRLCEKKPSANNKMSENDSCSVCEDIYFPYGAYTYFAGRLPQLLKMLDFLWFMLSGSSQDGLQALQRARAKSCMHNLGATNLLSTIYSAFEADTESKALSLSTELTTRFPNNPYIDLEHARILMAAGRFSDALRYADAIYAKAESGKPNYDAITNFGARLVRVEVDLQMGRHETARKTLSKLLSDKTLRNNTLTSYMDLLEGMAADVDGNRTAAMQYYKTAAAHNGLTRNSIVAGRAKQYLTMPYERRAIALNGIQDGKKL